ncbi:hypothetical protein MTR67_036915 [Solanum verrucosum]|uniref:Uncharacterized protein n=1 Tax=Solanum verrucosum TaxID=315347 RepID=A0AAF0UCZ6_SOLVR|nr:hypothetical protein MTR67_036915 [Solanum verrucosum]
MCCFSLHQVKLFKLSTPGQGGFIIRFSIGELSLQKTEVTGELSLPLFGGQYGKRGTLRVFENRESSMKQVKLNCILTLCFWCNQIYSNDTVSIIDVLDSL